jgi:hypothetical protein
MLSQLPKAQRPMSFSTFIGFSLVFSTLKSAEAKVQLAHC